MYQPGGGPRQPELDFEKIIGNISAGIGRVAQLLGHGGVGIALAVFHVRLLYKSPSPRDT